MEGMELYNDSMVGKGEVTQRWKVWSCTTMKSKREDSIVEKGEVTQAWKEWSCTTTALLRKGR